MLLLGRLAAAMACVLLLAEDAAPQGRRPDEVSALPLTLDGGEVSTHLRVGDMLFVGGYFTSVAPRSRMTGPFGVFDARSAELQAADPTLKGAVQAVVDDGVGGWFVANGNQILRLDASGRRQAWPVRLTGTSFAAVNAMARVGGLLILGGSFGEVNDQPRQRFAVVDISSANVLPVDVAISGQAIHALHVSGSSLYLGGQFSSVGGQPRSHVAKLDLATGALLPWAPPVDQDGVVRAIIERAGRVYIGGEFRAVHGAGRSNFAAVTAATGALDDFAPLLFSRRGWSSVRTLASVGATLFVGGHFDQVSTADRVGGAAFDLSSGALLPWSPLASGQVDGLAVVADGVVLAGRDLRTSSDWTSRSTMKVSQVTGTSVSWPAGPGGGVLAVWTDGVRVALGGSFHTHRAVPANYLLGINLADGSYTILPAPNGPVRALASDGERLYLGGSFSAVDGQPRALVAALDIASQQLLPFAPVFEATTVLAQVTALHLGGGRLYAGGAFDLVNGSPRVSLVALDPASGALLPWAPPPITGDVFRSIDTILAVSGRVWFGGRFSAVGAVPRQGLAALDEVSAALAPVDFAPDQPTRRFALDQGHLYVSGEWTHFGGLNRFRSARIDPDTAVLDPGWQIGYGGAGIGFSVLDGEAFVTGSFPPPASGLASFRLAFAPPPYLMSRTAWTPGIENARDVAAFQDGVFATGVSGFGESVVYFPRRAAGGVPHEVADVGVHLQSTLVTLRWTPSLTGATPDGYRVSAGSRPGATDIAVGDIGRTPQLTVQLPAGRYSVRVAPVANGVVGPASPELTFVAGATGCTTVPDAPTLHSASSTVLSWTAPIAGPVPTGYELRVALSPGGTPQLRLPLPDSSLTFPLAAAPPGTYFTTVAATNACGLGATSNELRVDVAAHLPPGPPTGLHAEVSLSGVTLTWTPPPGPVSRYVLEAGSAPGLANLLAGTALGPGTAVTVPGVPPGRYYVRVRAASGALVSLPSNEVAVDVR